MENRAQLLEYSSTVVYAVDKFGGRKPPGPPLQPPGGGGTSDGMEARVAKLEADVGHIKSDVSELKSSVKGLGEDVTAMKVSLATLTERVSHLPTKGYIGWWITGGVAACISGLTLLSKLGWLVAGAPK